MSNQGKRRNQAAVYEAQFTAGVKVDPQDPDHRTFLARISESDGRKAEALLMTENLSSLEIVRTLIFRGKLCEAKALISQNASSRLKPEARAEWLLEDARVNLFLGRFDKVIDLTTQALNQEPTNVSKISLHQVRSGAFFEKGEIAQSLKDAEAIETLSVLYPAGPSSFLSRVHKSKCVARLSGIKSGEILLKECWWIYKTGKTPQTRDSLVMLARAEIDFARLQGHCYFGWAILTALLSQDSGDDLFLGLSFLDIFLSEVACHNSEFLTTRIREAARQFSRIQDLLFDIEKSEPDSETGRKVVLYKKQRKEPKNCKYCPETLDLENLLKVTHVLLGKQKILISRSPFSLDSLDTRSRILRLLTVLAKGSQSKSEIFDYLYERQKYVSHLHDNTLRQSFSRLRKEFQISVLSIDGIVNAEDLYSVHG